MPNNNNNKNNENKSKNNDDSRKSCTPKPSRRAPHMTSTRCHFGGLPNEAKTQEMKGTLFFCVSEVEVHGLRPGTLVCT